MFKKIPGNPYYRIDLNETIVDRDGKQVTLEVLPRRDVRIEMFGEMVEISLRRLKLLAWFEVEAIEDIRKRIDNILFMRVESRILRSTCGYVMVFKEPIPYGEGFRVIPSFPGFAINIDGVVVNTATNETVDEVVAEYQQYPVAYIRNPDKNSNRNMPKHRLLALAWLPNDDFLTRPYINHIDGNKLNYRLDNLEWCSHTENVDHALTTGLAEFQQKMKSRDILTGEVVVYRSTAEMCRAIGTRQTAGTAFQYKMPGYLHNRRYEIKLFEDETPWFYESKENVSVFEGPVKSIYTITVIDKKTGEESTYNNVGPFRKKYGIWTQNPAIQHTVAAFKEKYPHCDVSYRRNAIVGPYRAINIKTNETFIFNSIISAANHIGITRTELQFDLSRHRKFIYGDTWIVLPSGKTKYDLADYPLKPAVNKKVEITYLDTGKVIVAESLSEATRITGIDGRAIVRRAKEKRPLKGIFFRPLWM